MHLSLRTFNHKIGMNSAPKGTLIHFLSELVRNLNWQGRERPDLRVHHTATAAAGDIDHGWLGLRDDILSGWYRNDTRELFEGFQIDPDDVVLDIGCGDGAKSRFCARFCREIILADIDSQKVARAERLMREEPVQIVIPIVTDANPLRLNDATASKIISSEVIEHVDDPVQFLGELVRVGKSGAQYLLSVPDAAGESVQTKLAPDASWRKPNHIRIISRDEFAKLVIDAGLVFEKRAYYGFYWAVYNAFLWPCNTVFDAPNHPVLDNWARAWAGLLDLPQGQVAKNALEQVMPKSQMIIARKP